MAEEKDTETKKLIQEKDTETKKLIQSAEKQKNRAETTLLALSETEQNLMAAKEELQRTEAEKEKLEKAQEKQEKKLKKGAGRADKLASDAVGGGLAHTMNFAAQSLIDALVEKWPTQLGKYAVAMKAAPPGLALIWYLVEVWSMKETMKLPKAIRLSAANTLQNVGLVYLAQAYRADQSAKKTDLAEKGQNLEETKAELAKAKKLLKDKGIDLDEVDNG